MRKLLCFSIIVLFFFGCKKEKKVNHFDEIIHYNIDNKIAKTNDTIKRFHEIFMSVYGHKISFETFEKELILYGYTKNSLDEEKIKKVDFFISNKIYYDSHLTACVPSYRDILILKKNKKTIAILKICFECSMIDKYGIINSTFKESDIDSYFVNFENLYKMLYNKEYKG